MPNDRVLELFIYSVRNWYEVGCSWASDVYVCAAANLEEPRFIPGRYRRDASQADVADSVTDSSIHTTSAADGLQTW